MTAAAGGRPSTATVLFTDLVGSTDLRRSLGDDQADSLRRAHDDLVRGAVGDHLGEIVKGTGDGFMVVFPAAAEAVSAAVAIQQRVARMNRNAAAPLGVRIGISAGDVSWEGDDCFGTPVVEANRLCAVADAGQIVVSEVVRLLAGSRGGHRLTPLGEVELKGLGPIGASEALWEPEPSATVPLPPPLASHDTLRLIGRVAERESLERAWKESVVGAHRVVLVAGEPGVGKTRLVAEIARMAHAEGSTVLFGRCDEELGVPYQPFVEAIASYAGACAPDVLRDQVGELGGDLTRLVPGLAARLPGLPDPLRADPETERFRLFEGVSAFVANVAASSPVVLVLDDIHWAAKPTLLLLRHLVRQRAATRLLVLATYRDTDLGRGHPLSEILGDLRREPDVERVALHGLSEHDVIELVSTAAGHELDAAGVEFARAVHAETEGNPFFVGQVLRHLVETGAVFVEDGRWVVSRVDRVGIPEGIREVVGKRLSQLGPETNEILSVAAVIGREFGSQLVAEASGADHDTVLDALEDAEAGRLIVAVSGHVDRRTFSHALVRSTLYEEIPTTRRLRVHRRVGEALERRHGGTERFVEELAHHFRESAALGEVDKALHWTRVAARAAHERLAYEEAAEQYERGLAVLDPDRADHAVDACTMRIELAREARAAGNLAAAREVALDAADRARALDRPDLLVDAALVLAGDRGWSEAGLVDDQLVVALEEALQALPAGDSRWRAMGGARLASELYFVETAADRRRTLTEEALAMARRLDDPEVLAFVLSCAIWGSWVPGSSQERLEQAREMRELARRAGNVLQESVAVMWMTGCHAEAGDGDEFLDSVALELEFARRLQMDEVQWVALVHAGAAAMIQGRVDEAERLMNEAIAIGQRLGAETPLQMYGVGLLALGRARGAGLAEIVPLIVALVEQYPLIPAWRCGLAYVYRELGMAEEAREQFEHCAVDDFASIPFDANWIVGLGILASVCEMLADVERASVLYDLMAPYAHCMITAGPPADVVGSVHLPLALTAATMQNWDLFESHIEHAVEANDRMRCPVWNVYTRWEQARILARRGHDGDVDRARAIARQTVDVAESIGLPRPAALCRALLAELDTSAG
jgi:class 3 adenylate cyclase/tetratricopeptide (TPR) repeat protein